MIEMAWKSSELEGNTYSLLETELLLKNNFKAKNKTSFETQMIINHRQAIAFALEAPELYRRAITYRTIAEIHRRLTDNLGIQPGVRRRLIRITASNYRPLATPQKLREIADLILLIINQQSDPAPAALLALSLLPYMQLFEDGNKRLGRILANAILIQATGRGLSLIGTDAKELALAYLAFYEFNSLNRLAKILEDGLSRPKPA